MNIDSSDLLKALFEDPAGTETTRSINQITEIIIGCAYTVGNSLGCGFLEKVYENALVHEIRKKGLDVKQQHEVTVHYDNIVVGSYCADLLVENSVLVELKATRDLNEVMWAQCINYLRATNIGVCLLINFGNP